MKTENNKLLAAGALTAVVASLCCLTPVLALITGATGIAALFSGMEPIRPYLIGLSVVVLGFAWFQKLKPKTQDIHCECEEDEKKPFMHSKSFLSIVTVFAALILAFPNYAHLFYPANEKKEVVFVNASNMKQATFEVKGMTCNGCAAHVETEINKLPGILSVDAIYEEATAKVEFDQSKVSLAQIEEAINATGYKVVGKK